MKTTFDKINLILPTALFLITILTFTFAAGKLTESIAQNTLAIQKNCEQIKQNSNDIIYLKESKVVTETEIKNINKKLDEIGADVKELLKK